MLFLGESLEQPVDLMLALEGAQPKMRDDYLNDFPVDFQIHIHGAPRFTTGNTQVDAAHVEDPVRGEQSISITSSALGQSIAVDDVEAGAREDIIDTARFPSRIMPEIKFLKPDDIGVDFSYDINDTIRVPAAVPPFASVNIVGSH
jgi:hypothetical protein